MFYSKSGLQLTEKFEGCKLTAYRDSTGVLTIGYGHTRGVYSGMTCNYAQAEQWLMQDTFHAVSIVNDTVHVPLTQNEFDALVDFAFNCGETNEEHSTLLRLVNEGRIEEAANEFEKWDKAGGVALAGLLRRRLSEKAEFLGESTNAT